MPYDRESQQAALKAVKAEGFETMLDVISIKRGRRFENLRVQTEQSPYFHFLVKFERVDGTVVRIDVRKNDDQRSIDRSLSNVEEDRSRRRQEKGVFERVYLGLVSEGKDKGKHQTWSLVYYP